MKFNRIWTKEKNDELRNLIKEGRTVDYIKSHFGECLDAHPKRKYSSSKLLPFKQFFEIKITPVETQYSYKEESSPFFKGNDYILVFNHKINYVIMLLYFPINNKETYNVIFTTEDQYIEYRNNLSHFISGNLGVIEYETLKSIIERETNLNELYPVIKRISFIILDFYKNLNSKLLSIGDTDEPVKIKLYRNIIRDSFHNITESEEEFEGNKYFLYIMG